MDEDITCKCGKTFKVHGSLTRHVKTDHVPGQCKKCGLDLTDKLEHRGKECSRKKEDITCGRCEKKFACPKNFGKHMHTHTIKDDSEYVFRKKFSNEFKLDAVKMVKENGFKQTSLELKIATSTLKNWVTLCKDPKTCQFCGKVFPYQFSLDMHVKRAHENPSPKTAPIRNYEKPFKTEVAKFAIEHSIEMASEKFGVPGGTLRSWVKILKSPFICDFCGYCVAKKCELEIHMKRKHKVEVPIENVDSSATSFYNFVSKSSEKVNFSERISYRRRDQYKNETEKSTEDVNVDYMDKEKRNTKQWEEIKKRIMNEIEDKSFNENKIVKIGDEEEKEILEEVSNNKEEREEQIVKKEYGEGESKVHDKVSKNNEQLKVDERDGHGDKTVKGADELVSSNKSKREVFDRTQIVIEEDDNESKMMKREDEEEEEESKICEQVSKNIKEKNNVKEKQIVKRSEDESEENIEGKILREELVVLNDVGQIHYEEDKNCEKEEDIKEHKLEDACKAGIESPFEKFSTNVQLAEQEKEIKEETQMELLIEEQREEKAEPQNIFPMDLLKKGNKNSYPGAIFKCTECGYIPEKQTKRDIKLHMKMHRELLGLTRPFTRSDTVNLTCEHCDKKFKAFSDLKRHVLKHTGERSWQCDVCSRSFGTRFRLTRHMLTHSESREQVIYTCKQCGKGFTSTRSRNVHELNHNGLFPHHCENCNKGFNEKSVMQKHIVKRHGGSYSNFCDKCGKGFMTGRALNTHLPICGKMKPRKKKKNTSAHPCNLCSKIFNRNCNLERHLKTHTGEKDYSCDQCGKQYRDYRSIRSHTRKKHESIEKQ